jgi:hypothetical protein
MKPLLFSFLLLTGFSCNVRWVYICDSPYARRYHYKEDCRGLKRCDHQIIKITLDEAEKRSLTPCHLEE